MNESLAELTKQLDQVAEISELIGEVFGSLYRARQRCDFLDHAEHQYPKLRRLYCELVYARETLEGVNAQLLGNPKMLTTGETKILKKRGIRVTRKMRLAQLQCHKLKDLLYQMLEVEKAEGARG